MAISTTVFFTFNLYKKMYSEDVMAVNNMHKLKIMCKQQNLATLIINFTQQI